MGLSAALVERLQGFTTAYDEGRLPIDGAGGPDHLALGAALLEEVRAALAGRFTVVTTEPWWSPVSRPPAAGPRPRP